MTITHGCPDQPTYEVISNTAMALMYVDALPRGPVTHRGERPTRTPPPPHRRYPGVGTSAGDDREATPARLRSPSPTARAPGRRTRGSQPGPASALRPGHAEDGERGDGERRDSAGGDGDEGFEDGQGEGDDGENGDGEDGERGDVKGRPSEACLSFPFPLFWGLVATRASQQSQEHGIRSREGEEEDFA